MPDTTQKRHIRAFPGGEVLSEWLEVVGGAHVAVSARMSAAFPLPAGPKIRLLTGLEKHAWRGQDITLGNEVFDALYRVKGGGSPEPVRLVLASGVETLTSLRSEIFSLRSDGKRIRVELNRRSYASMAEAEQGYGDIMKRIGRALEAMVSADLFGVGALLELPDAHASWPKHGPPIVTTRECPDVRFTVEYSLRRVRCVARYRFGEMAKPRIPALPAGLNGSKVSLKRGDAEFRFPGICRDQEQLLAAGRFLRSLGGTSQPYR